MADCCIGVLLDDIAGRLIAGCEAAWLTKGLMPAIGELEPEWSGSKSLSVLSTWERSSPINTSASSLLGSLVLSSCKPACYLYDDLLAKSLSMCLLLFRVCSTQCTVCYVSPLSTGVLTNALGPTAKTGKVRIQLGF